MYRLNDKKSAIRDVQQFLLVIGQNGDIPHLSVDGFYSEETKEAVKEFQRLHSLEITGAVERYTFDKIYSEYLKIINLDILCATEFDSGVFPMRLGDSGNSVAALNAIIREMSVFYRDLPSVYGDFYSKDTESAIRLIQRYLRQNEDGETTEKLYNEIKRALINQQKYKQV